MDGFIMMKLSHQRCSSRMEVSQPSPSTEFSPRREPSPTSPSRVRGEAGEMDPFLGLWPGL